MTFDRGLAVFKCESNESGLSLPRVPGGRLIYIRLFPHPHIFYLCCSQICQDHSTERDFWHLGWIGRHESLKLGTNKRWCFHRQQDLPLHCSSKRWLAFAPNLVHSAWISTNWDFICASLWVGVVCWGSTTSHWLLSDDATSFWQIKDLS